MVARDLNVSLKSGDVPKSFLDRHFTPLLGFVGVLLLLLINFDFVKQIIANQPPDALLIIQETRVELGSKLLAFAVPSDIDGPVEDILYKWAILGRAELKLPGGYGKTEIDLPTDKLGKFSVMLTVTDRRGKGKAVSKSTPYEVIPKALAAPIAVARVLTSTGSEGQANADELLMTGDTVLDWSKTSYRRILTNGYRLEINADSLNYDLDIRSFDVPAKPGIGGVPGLPGANGGSQQAGGAGLPGAEGMPGANGAAPKAVIVKVSGPLAARLSISNHGQSGGTGGQGGQGGPGGTGGQGNSAQPGFIDCRSGPGYGGAGGDGGAGGPGGAGGSGGKGGNVFVSKEADKNFIRTISNAGGQGGQPGPGGAGGIAGAGGPEGQSGGACQSAGRTGPSGKTGTPGVPGAMGKSAQGGKFLGNADSAD